MKGQPLTCRCPNCKNKASAGAYWKIVFTGESKPCFIQRRGRRSRSQHEKFQNRCERCKHVWWSVYKGITQQD